MSIKLEIKEIEKMGRTNYMEQQKDEYNEIDPPLSESEISERKHEKRVVKIIKDESLSVNPVTLKRYLDCFKEKLRLPFKVTGIESDFEYSDYGDKTPNANERFEVVEFIEDVENYSNLFVKVRVENTSEIFELQLFEFKPIESSVEIIRMFEDYTEWIETCL
nr:hypothetical protein [uncultured Marinifilum sp.]